MCRSCISPLFSLIAYNMKKVNIYLILTALLLVVLGVVCIINPGEAFVAASWLVGLLILLSGVFGLLFGLRAQRFLPNAGSTTLLAVFQIIVGFLFLCNGLVAAESLIIVFVMWVIFEGISLSVLSFDYKKSGYDGWWIMALLGIFSLILGIIALHNPAGVGTFMGILLGLGILANGVDRIVAVFALKRIRNIVRDLHESATATPIDN